MSWARNSVGERGDNIGLPDVTTADNGKIMEVEGGEWKLKEGSGGGGGGIPAPANPSDGDVLTYDGTTSAWVAAAPSGGGGGGTIYIAAIVYDYEHEEAELTLHYGSALGDVVTVEDVKDDLANGPVYIKFEGATVEFDTSDPSDPFYSYFYGMAPLEFFQKSNGIGSSATDSYVINGTISSYGRCITGEFSTLSEDAILSLFMNIS